MWETQEEIRAACANVREELDNEGDEASAHLLGPWPAWPVASVACAWPAWPAWPPAFKATMTSSPRVSYVARGLCPVAYAPLL